MSNTYQDGIIPWDSFVAAVGAKTFIFEDFNPTEPSTTAVSGDQQLAPRAARDTIGMITASGTMQFPAGATTADAPVRFQTFTHPNYRGATKLFVITEVSLPQKAGQEIKMPFKCREVLNPPANPPQ